MDKWINRENGKAEDKNQKKKISEEITKNWWEVSKRNGISLWIILRKTIIWSNAEPFSSQIFLIKTPRQISIFKINFAPYATTITTI